MEPVWQRGWLAAQAGPERAWEGELSSSVNSSVGLEGKGLTEAHKEAFLAKVDGEKGSTLT